MRKKILFITPPYHCGVVEVAGRWVPLTFVYLAGAVKKAGFEPIIYDAMTKQHNFDNIKKMISDIKPEFVATTAITSTVPDALEILRIAKDINPEIITIIGGVHPTFMYKEILLNNSVDYIVRGEGEETIQELLLCINNNGDLSDVKGIAYKYGHNIVANQPRPFIEDLDKLPTAWDLIEWKDYRYFVIPQSRLGAVSTSRGCNHNCSFCSQQKFWHQTWRKREPRNVVNEIEYLAKTYGVNVFLIPDEYPTNDRERWERFLDILIEKDLGVYLLMETRAEDILRDRDILHKYRKAGIVHIYIGVEATDQETLDLIKKDIKVETGMEAIKLIHEHGMITETSFILGFPHETQESIKRTLKLSKIYNPDFAHFLALAPWPYADMYQELKPYIITHDYRRYNLIDPVIKPERMSIEDIDRAIIDCYQGFYIGKLKDILSMTDEFKKRYLLTSMKLMMSSSFIVNKLGSIGRIPPHVETLIRKLDSTEEEQDGFITKIRESIYINAPLKDVFNILSTPKEWPGFINNLVSVKNIHPVPIREGTEFEWTYNIKGIRVKGKGKFVNIIKDRLVILKMHHLFPIMERFYLEGDNNSTKVTVEVGYTNPDKVLNFLFYLGLRTINVIEAKRILSNLKKVCEEKEEIIKNIPHSFNKLK